MYLSANCSSPQSLQTPVTQIWQPAVINKAVYVHVNDYDHVHVHVNVNDHDYGSRKQYLAEIAPDR
jgi:hypothetical protein